MWKAEATPRTESLELNSEDRGAAPAVVPDFEPPDAHSFLLRHPGAQRLLEELRGQVVAGVTPAVPDGPRSSNAPTVGSRFTAELARVSRREHQVREMQELAMRRVVDLTSDQLRRILAFMA